MVCEISIRSLQINHFSSEAFVGVANVNVTNVLGKRQYFFDRSGCIEKALKKIEIGMTIVRSVEPLSPTYAFGVVLTFSMVRFW